MLLELIDRGPIENSDIRQITRITCNVENLSENLPAFVTKLVPYPLVPGIYWMQYHDITLLFDSDFLSFDSSRYQKGCLEKETPDMVETVYRWPQISRTGAAAMCLRMQNQKSYEDERVYTNISL